MFAPHLRSMAAKPLLCQQTETLGMDSEVMSLYGRRHVFQQAIPRTQNEALPAPRLGAKPLSLSFIVCRVGQ